MSFAYLKNRSSDRLHTWRVYCWGPKEVQCQMWCNLTRWWRCNNELYLLACNLWTVTLRNVFFFWFSTILNCVQIRFFATTPINFEQSSPFGTEHLWTKLEEVTFLFFLCTIQFYYSWPFKLAQMLWAGLIWQKLSYLLNYCNHIWRTRVDVMSEWPWQIWCSLANRWRCSSIIQL